MQAMDKIKIEVIFMSNMDYIIITPSKNEASNLPHIISSINKQTVLPVLWVIVNDGSTDSTSDILNSANQKYPYIMSITLGPHPRDLGAHYAYVCKKGFDFATEYCYKNNIIYSYISIVDADMILEPTFFEKILLEFLKNNSYGIISGGVHQFANNQLIIENTCDNLPRGGCRVWNKRCFEETDGYQITICPDSVSNVKAMLRGWSLLQLKNAVAIQTRPTSGAEGLLKGFKNNGKFAYCLNKHPLLVFINVVNYIFKKSPLIAVAYLYGYLDSVISKPTKVSDEEVKYYFWNTRINDLFRWYIKKI